MGKKRKHQETGDETLRKIKKYQQKIEKLQRRPSPVPIQTPPSPPTPLRAGSQISLTPDKEDLEDVILIENENEQEEDNLDEEILHILGDPPEDQKYGPNIHKELATRWTAIIKNGLSKEKRAEIKKKYLPPQNCLTIDAPKLNLEAQAAVTDAAVKRDKAISVKQNQISCALSAIALAFGQLIKNKENIESINYITDAARLLCDHQHQESATRRHFILQGLDQSTRDSIKDTEIDQWLFGESFAEKLKASKAIKKSGQEISINKYKKPQQQQQVQQQIQRRPLNFKGPVTYPPRSRTYQAGPQRSYQTYKKPVTQTTVAPQPRRNYAQSKAPLRPPNNRN